MNALARLRHEDPFMFGFVVSIAGHLTLLLIFIVRFGSGFGPFPQPIVYSVSIEGGKSLGGRSQVAEKPDTPIAPPKNVSQKEEKKETKTEVKEKTPEEKADVSLAEKKPTPKATPQKAPEKKAEKKQAVDPDKDYQKAMQRYLGESSESSGKGFGAATLGGKGMGGGTQRSPEFIAYYNLLREHIKRGWRWYDEGANYTARAAFRISREGQVSAIRMLKGSGSREFDDSVLRALAKADPVPVPPASVYEDFKEVSMIFDPRE